LDNYVTVNLFLRREGPDNEIKSRFKNFERGVKGRLKNLPEIELRFYFANQILILCQEITGK